MAKSILIVAPESPGELILVHGLFNDLKEGASDSLNLTILAKTDAAGGISSLCFDREIRFGPGIYGKLRGLFVMGMSSYDQVLNFRRDERFDWLRLIFPKKYFSFGPSGSFWKNESSNLINFITLAESAGHVLKKLNFKLKLKKSVSDSVLAKLKSFGLRPEYFRVLGLGGGFNQWPYVGDFVKTCLSQSEIPLVIVAPVEMDFGFLLTVADIYPDKIFIWQAKEFSLEEKTALLNFAHSFVGSDPDLICLAGSVGVPSVALFGPSHPRFQEPPGLGKSLVPIVSLVPCSPCYKPQDQSYDRSCGDRICMKSISPREVFNALSRP